MNNRILFIYGTLLLIQILFGINFSTSKVIVGSMDPILWSNIRFFVAGILMLLVTIASRRKHPPMTKEFFLPLIPLSALGMALGQGLFLFGLKHTSSVNTAVLTTTIPILTLVIVVARRQEELTWYKLVGFIWAFAGVVLIRDLTQASFELDSFFGDAMVFLGALCFAFYLSFGKQFLQKFDHLWITTYMFLTSSVLMLFFNIGKIKNFEAFPTDNVFWICAAFTILGATLLTYFLNNLVLTKAPSGHVALFIYFQPVVAGVFSWYFLDEQIGLRTVLCSALIMFGLIISIYPSLRRSS
ncbi:MAG: DMT family transporter [Bacteriovoracaceae bacterium]|nr:DMT family transporter [Bacteriovoracaceae bacterium]